MSSSIAPTSPKGQHAKRFCGHAFDLSDHLLSAIAARDEAVNRDKQFFFAQVRELAHLRLVVERDLASATLASVKFSKFGVADRHIVAQITDTATSGAVRIARAVVNNRRGSHRRDDENTGVGYDFILHWRRRDAR